MLLLLKNIIRFVDMVGITVRIFFIYICDALYECVYTQRIHQYI